MTIFSRRYKSPYFSLISCYMPSKFLRIIGFGLCMIFKSSFCFTGNVFPLLIKYISFAGQKNAVNKSLKCSRFKKSVISKTPKSHSFRHFDPNCSGKSEACSKIRFTCTKKNLVVPILWQCHFNPPPADHYHPAHYHLTSSIYGTILSMITFLHMYI